jgi:hypothetical protein
MTSGRILRLKPTSAKAPSRKKGIGLTEIERQLIVAELADIAAELDELQNRAAEITVRVSRTSSARRAG